MRLKVAIFFSFLVIVGFVCYNIFHRAAVRDEIAIRTRNECVRNLRLIVAAKHDFSMESKKGESATPSWERLRQFSKDGVVPICPSGGKYTVNDVETLPTCSIPDHALP